ncbi:MAG: hypothetical protein V2I36_09070 [Desulfopila sp.]|jgi:hypothetical protein|nr:hypothetical protein [Desulfopila sp.]
MLNRKYLSLFFFLVMVLPLTLLFSGCKVIQTIDSFNGILEKPPPEEEIGVLLQAEFAFLGGNFELAEELYSRVRQSSENEVYRNSALYGLACVAMITATSFTELQQAIEQLQTWQEPGGDFAGYEENPRLIATALARQSELFECEPEIRYVVTKKEDDLLRKHREEIRELKSIIVKLEHQISVLETIDQEIQEKRKPI